MGLPSSVDGSKVALFLNHACNLRCSYCYNGEPFSRPMSSETARRAVDFALARSAGTGFLMLTFFGGEPLLELARMEEATLYAEEAARRQRQTLRFGVATNTTLIDDRALELFAAHDFRVQASIDGGERAQDACRRRADGSSSWAAVSAGLARLVARKVELQVVAVVDPANAAFLDDSYRALRDHGVKRVLFAPNLHGAWDDAARERLEAALVRLGDLWRADVSAGVDVRLDPFHGKVASQLIGDSREPVRCSFGERELAVSPRGRIYACDRMVKDDTDEATCLGDLDRGLDEARLAEVRRQRAHVEPECAACELVRRCMHRCGCQNHELTGDPGRVSPMLCWWERTVIGETDRVANALYEAKDPEFLRRFYGVQKTIKKKR